MRRSPGSRSALPRATSTSWRLMWAGLTPFRPREASLRVLSPSFIWESLSTVERSVQRCSCSSGKRLPIGFQVGPTDTYLLEVGSRSLRAPLKRSRSTYSKPSSRQLAHLTNWISSWLGSFGVRLMREKGHTRLVGIRSAVQLPKGGSAFEISKRYSEPLLLNYDGASGSKILYGLDT